METLLCEESLGDWGLHSLEEEQLWETLTAICPYLQEDRGWQEYREP